MYFYRSRIWTACIHTCVNTPVYGFAKNENQTENNIHRHRGDYWIWKCRPHAAFIDPVLVSN